MRKLTGKCKWILAVLLVTVSMAAGCNKVKDINAISGIYMSEKNYNYYKESNELYQKYKKNKHIAMLGVSFDMDKKEWQDAIKRDTLNWEQVCDFGGLNSEVAKQYAIKQVPSNILLSADGKILAKNLKGEQLKKKIEEAVTAAEEKEKQDNKKKK